MKTKAPIQAKAAAESSLTGLQADSLKRQWAAAGLDGERDLDRSKLPSGPSLTGNQAQSIGLPPVVQEVLRAPGQPLEPATRAFMESRFGHDFSQVRVHTDAKAAESARTVNARAYTVGRDVVFKEGGYAPDTSEGRRLMAHELAHVVQQRAGCATLHSPHWTETDASRASSDIMAGRVATVKGVAAPNTVQCTPDKDKPSLVNRFWRAAQAAVNTKLEAGKLAANIFELGQEEVKKRIDQLETAIIRPIQDTADKAEKKPYAPLVRAAAKAGKFQVELAGGAGKAVVKMVGGLAQIGVNPVGTAIGLTQMNLQGPLPLVAKATIGGVGDMARDIRSGKLLGQSTLKAFERIDLANRQGVRNQLGMGRKMIDDYEKARSERKYGEIAGMAIIDIGSFFIPGGATTKGGKAASVGRLAETVPRGAEIFSELTHELGLAPRGTGASMSFADVVREGQSLVNQGLVDFAVQPHAQASSVRRILGLSGRAVESAHLGPTSFLRDLFGYSRGGAETVLLPKNIHRALDQPWKNWAIGLRRAGQTGAPQASDIFHAMAEAIEHAPGLTSKVKGSLTWKTFDELYRTLGLSPTQTQGLRLAYPHVKPGVRIATDVPHHVPTVVESPPGIPGGTGATASEAAQPRFRVEAAQPLEAVQPRLRIKGDRLVDLAEIEAELEQLAEHLEVEPIQLRRQRIIP